MNINEQALSVKDHPDLKVKMLNWSDRFNIFCLLDTNGCLFEQQEFECLIAAGCRRSYNFTDENTFAGLQSFFNVKPSWLFGHLAYNAAGNAYADNRKAEIDFGKGFFFEPEIILRLTNETLTIVKANISAGEIFEQIQNTTVVKARNSGNFEISPHISKEKYLHEIEKLRSHIKRGDCYEINFCQRFYSHDAVIDPVNIYRKLSSLSPMPFAAFYKLNGKYCICASPERFLQKKGLRLVSQPIKGTKRRDLSDPGHDKVLADELRSSLKEQAENVMIVDLVRNDLSIVAQKGSVKVAELFGVYHFPQVHHLISTIEATLASDRTFTDAINACYPMGSMTGAPKKRVMELIADVEDFDRGLFSGSIGYITPDADFDLNVVIRSIFYDAAQEKLNFFAGGGITFNSIAENEFDECNAKAEAIMKILSAEKD